MGKSRVIPIFSLLSLVFASLFVLCMSAFAADVSVVQKTAQLVDWDERIYKIELAVDPVEINGSKAVDVVFVLDLSASMYYPADQLNFSDGYSGTNGPRTPTGDNDQVALKEYDETRMFVLKESVFRFINTLSKKSPTSRVAIVTFKDYGYQLAGFTMLGGNKKGEDANGNALWDYSGEDNLLKIVNFIHNSGNTGREIRNTGDPLNDDGIDFGTSHYHRGTNSTFFVNPLPISPKRYTSTGSATNSTVYDAAGLVPGTRPDLGMRAAYELAKERTDAQKETHNLHVIFMTDGVPAYGTATGYDIAGNSYTGTRTMSGADVRNCAAQAESYASLLKGETDGVDPSAKGVVDPYLMGSNSAYTLPTNAKPNTPAEFKTDKATIWSLGFFFAGTFANSPTSQPRMVYEKIDINAVNGTRVTISQAASIDRSGTQITGGYNPYTIDRFLSFVATHNSYGGSYGMGFNEPAFRDFFRSPASEVMLSEKENHYEYVAKNGKGVVDFFNDTILSTIANALTITDTISNNFELLTDAKLANYGIKGKNLLGDEWIINQGTPQAFRLNTKPKRKQEDISDKGNALDGLIEWVFSPEQTSYLSAPFENPVLYYYRGYERPENSNYYDATDLKEGPLFNPTWATIKTVEGKPTVNGAIWRAVFYIRAREDFIGGDLIATNNAPMSSLFKREDVRQVGYYFPTPYVNVKMKPFPKIWYVWDNQLTSDKKKDDDVDTQLILDKLSIETLYGSKESDVLKEGRGTRRYTNAIVDAVNGQVDLEKYELDAYKDKGYSDHQLGPHNIWYDLKTEDMNSIGFYFVELKKMEGDNVDKTEIIHHTGDMQYVTYKNFDQLKATKGSTLYLFSGDATAEHGYIPSRYLANIESFQELYASMVASANDNTTVSKKVSEDNVTAVPKGYQYANRTGASEVKGHLKADGDIDTDNEYTYYYIQEKSILFVTTSAFEIKVQKRIPSMVDLNGPHFADIVTKPAQSFFYRIVKTDGGIEQPVVSFVLSFKAGEDRSIWKYESVFLDLNFRGHYRVYEDTDWSWDYKLVQSGLAELIEKKNVDDIVVGKEIDLKLSSAKSNYIDFELFEGDEFRQAKGRVSTPSQPIKKYLRDSYPNGPYKRDKNGNRIVATMAFKDYAALTYLRDKDGKYIVDSNGERIIDTSVWNDYANYNHRVFEIAWFPEENTKEYLLVPTIVPEDSLPVIASFENTPKDVGRTLGDPALALNEVQMGEQVYLPDITGMTVAEIEGKLKELGFEVGTTVTTYDPNALEGTSTISLRPQAAKRLRGTKITVVKTVGTKSPE